MQPTKNASSFKERALSVLDQFKSGRKGDLQRLTVIMLAIRGKKINFEKALRMIDDMAALLKQEQLDEDHKSGVLVRQFDQADDEKKALERAEGKLTAPIADTQETITTLAGEIKTLSGYTRTWPTQLPKRFKTL